jgi:hypothetical protein
MVVAWKQRSWFLLFLVGHFKAIDAVEAVPSSAVSRVDPVRDSPMSGEFRERKSQEIRAIKPK